MCFQLSTVRGDMAVYMDSLWDKEGRYGAYRTHPGGRTDLYASLDIAIARTLYGENLSELPAEQRQEWISHINSFADEYLKDGSYTDTFGHSKLHANGMVIGALGPLGGKQKYPCRLYDAFSAPEQIAGWLEAIDWEAQWSASHLFWGGMHCFSFSKHCTARWKESVQTWLLKNCDTNTGFWRHGTRYADRHQALGGLVHILPIFEHQGWVFPFIQRTIDSTLAMQLPNGRWHSASEGFPASYLDLDALYVLCYGQTHAPGYRTQDVIAACQRFATPFLYAYANNKALFYGQHPHFVLAGIGIFGLLQRLLPSDFADDRAWNDIFSDRRLYQTALVQAD